MNYKSVLFLGLILLFSSFGIAQNATGYVLRRVVIDPGHGGKDPGAIGTGRYHNTESDVALAVSLKLRDYILEYYDSVEVVMTREKDNFVELRERTKIANDAKADLFISIHCNTNGNQQAYGTETYIIGMHKTQSNMEVAKRENQVIYLEDNYEAHYSGFDPNSPESMIGLSMLQSQYLDQSIMFADYVQTQFTTRVGRKNRGVKQAGYWVISYTMMPSVLIELGFISNPGEEDFLNTEKGQVYMASAIYRAFKKYKTELEGYDSSRSAADKSNSSSTKKNETSVKPVVKQSKSETQISLGKELKSAEGQLVFKVQIATSTKLVSLEKQNFKGCSELSKEKEGKLYKYYSGNFEDLKDAELLQNELRKKKYKDCFVVAFYNGKQISITEAKELIK